MDKQIQGVKIKTKTKKSRYDKPLVSIVTPVFNGRLYLEQTIQSVIGQTYDNIEYIVIDGGSTDGSLEIIQKYEDNLDYWLSEPDSGMYDAINKGLKIASGDILAYLNADDLYYPDTVKIAVEYFQKYPDTELIYGNCDFISPSGALLYTYRYPRFQWKKFILLNICSIPQQTTFWRRAIHKKIGYFDTALKLCGDFDFYAKAGRDCRIDHMNATLACYRIHDNSLTALQGYRNRDEVDLIRRRYNNQNRIWRMMLGLVFMLRLKLLNISVILKRACLRLRKDRCY